jgi:hypothetical protein
LAFFVVIFGNRTTGNNIKERRDQGVISTVTTVTTTTTTTAGAVTMATAFTAMLGLLAAITLIVLLIVKELAGAASDSSSTPEFTLQGALDRVLNVGIVPLLIVFAFIVVVKVMDIL